MSRGPTNARHYKYYDLVMAAFVTVLLCSDLIGPGKVCRIAGFSFGAGNLFFPISYIFGDILTEVYGYARARKVIWAGFTAMIFATFMSQVVLRMPADPGVAYNAVIDPALHTVFGNTWRIVAGSLLAFWAGDFVNSYVLAKMKLWTKGRLLWTRTIGSTAAGQAVDSMIFYPVAFWGTWDPSTMVTVIASNYAIKVAWEAINTPVTYAIVAFLKKAENEDWYDTETDFTPFSLKD